MNAKKNERCLFCCEDVKRTQNESDDTDSVDCPNCGKFKISRDAYDVIKGDTAFINERHLASGYIRELNDAKKQVELITQDNYRHLINNHMTPRTIVQYLNKVLLYYYRISVPVGRRFNFNINDKRYAASYARTPQEACNFIRLLIDDGLLESANTIQENAIGGFKLTLKGLSHAESLLSAKATSDKVFIATKFGAVKGYEFLYTDVREKAIAPAVKEACGLTAFTVDQEEHNDYITDRIIAEIKASRFLIADLTHNNNGVYWESGYAKGLGKEVIYICNQEWLNESGNKTHFDIEQVNCIRWCNLEELKEKLCNRIRATIIP